MECLKKVLLIDTCIDGHHLEYLSTIANSLFDCVVMIPEESDRIKKNVKVIVNKFDIEKCNFFSYLNWLKDAKKVAEKENIEVIHFLTADFMVKFFGIGLLLLKRYKLILTFHHFKHSAIRDIARRMLSNKADINVVHTDKLLVDARKNRMKNFEKVTYPCFLHHKQVQANISKAMYGIPNDGTPVLAAIGATRYDKGLDILLKALNKVKKPFCLLIAGQEDYFTKDFIEKSIENYRQRVYMKLDFLSDEEMYHAINGSEIIVLPYRKCFDGASGPLTDAVALGKIVIGPSHGSLGRQIMEKELGAVFSTEDEKSLSNTIEMILDGGFTRNRKYESFRSDLNVELFIKRYMGIYSRS